MRAGESAGGVVLRFLARWFRLDDGASGTELMGGEEVGVARPRVGETGRGMDGCIMYMYMYPVSCMQRGRHMDLDMQTHAASVLTKCGSKLSLRCSVGLSAPYVYIRACYTCLIQTSCPAYSTASIQHKTTHIHTKHLSTPQVSVGQPER